MVLSGECGRGTTNFVLVPQAGCNGAISAQNNFFLFRGEGIGFGHARPVEASGYYKRRIKIGASGGKAGICVGARLVWASW